jgi:hypothetical protein
VPTAPTDVAAAPRPTPCLCKQADGSAHDPSALQASETPLEGRGRASLAASGDVATCRRLQQAEDDVSGGGGAAAGGARAAPPPSPIDAGGRGAGADGGGGGGGAGAGVGAGPGGRGVAEGEVAAAAAAAEAAVVEDAAEGDEAQLPSYGVPPIATPPYLPPGFLQSVCRLLMLHAEVSREASLWFHVCVRVCVCVCVCVYVCVCSTGASVQTSSSERSRGLVVRGAPVPALERLLALTPTSPCILGPQSLIRHGTAPASACASRRQQPPLDPHEVPHGPAMRPLPGDLPLPPQAAALNENGKGRGESGAASPSGQQPAADGPPPPSSSPQPRDSAIMRATAQLQAGRGGRARVFHRAKPSDLPEIEHSCLGWL